MKGASDEEGRRWVEAAYWVDTLQHASDIEVAPERLRSFATWARDAANLRTYDQVFQILWDCTRYGRRKVPNTRELAGDTYDPSVSVEEWLSRRKAQKSIRTRRSPDWLRIATAVGATVFFAVMVSSLLTRNGRRASKQEWVHVYETPLGTSREFTLPDGTVTMAAGLTTFSARYTASYRTIVIDRGEVLFKVTHNVSHPFHVFAGPARITAVGTTFDVRRDAERTSIAVTEGIVDVRPTTQSDDVSSTKRPDPVLWRPVLLQRGQRISYEDDGHISSVDHADPQDATAWEDGLLRFDHEPLRSVVQAVNRYSRVPIVIDDPEVESYLYSGTVIQDQTDEWILGLERIFPVRIVNDGERVHLALRSKQQK